MGVIDSVREKIGSLAGRFAAIFEDPNDAAYGDDPIEWGNGHREPTQDPVADENIPD